MNPQGTLRDPGEGDWSRTPWTYPGTPASGSGLLRDGELSPLVPTEVSLEDRALVVAVGSNASPAVMTRKLALAGVSTTLPFLSVRLHGLAVGHGAYVSIHGHIPAAPFLEERAVTATFASLLDSDQLGALDRTEPNYHRTRVKSSTGAACRLEMDWGDEPESFMVYVSRWGVLGSPGGQPWPQTPQEDVVRRLQRECPPYAAWVADFDGPRAVMRGLAAGGELRRRVREMFQSEGWSRSSGLASGLDWGQSAG